MFGENTKTTISVVCEHLGFGNVKRVSLRVKDVVADDVCELFGVFHVQTVPTFSDTARIPLITFYGRPISGCRSMRMCCLRHCFGQKRMCLGVAPGREPPGVIEGVAPLCFPDVERHREANNHLNNKRRTTHIKHLLA
jgi:hypothetical protein